MLINELPAFAERVCCNDVHVHVIESRGSKPLDQLEAIVCTCVPKRDLSRAYFYEGRNYLVKMNKDLDWLDEFAPLCFYLGSNFSFKNNPLVLTAEFKRMMHLNSRGLSIVQNRKVAICEAENMFGHPSGFVTRHIGGALISWKGATKLGCTFEAPTPCFWSY